MNTRSIIAAAFLLLLFSQVSALEFTVNRGSFQKGDTLEISGTAESDVTIKASMDEKIIFSRSVSIDAAGEFFFSKKISFLEPKGAWNIVVSDDAESIPRVITINPSRESEFLAISFLSPTPITYGRTDSFIINVRITDAGVAATDAAAYYWDIDGDFKSLGNNYDGTYSTEYKIPFNSKVGEWTLTVSAKKYSAEHGEIGGESSINLLVEKSPILIEVIKPKITEYEVGQDIEIEIRTSYPDGSPVRHANISAVANFEGIVITETEEGTYYGKYSPREIREELVTIDITAKDSAENIGTKTISLKPSGYLFWLLRENAIFYIFPMLFLAYILILSFNELRTFFKHTKLTRSKHELLELKKRLHNDFYKRSIISEKAFNRKNAEYNSKLDKIETELETLKK